VYLIDGVISDSDTFNALSPFIIETIRLERDPAYFQWLGVTGRNATAAIVVTTKPECEPAP
jgi:hypothetical protein